jgi:hypothetical protein
MRILFYFSILILTIGCTSTRKLTKQFSDKPETVNMEQWSASYSNTAIERPSISFNPNTSNQGKSVDPKQSSLWMKLSHFRTIKDSLPSIPETALIHLQMQNNKTLKVAAYQVEILLASYTIPVKQRNNYLILENKNRVIPIPILYFEIKEEKTILAPLANDRLGITTLNGHTLWILFMAAGGDSHFSAEYQKIDQ